MFFAYNYIENFPKGVSEQMSKKKLIIIIISAILACILIVVGVAGLAFRKEIATISSISADTETGICVINYTADYDLESVLNTKGVSSPEEMVSILKNGIFKGLPIGDKINNLYCEGFSFSAKTPEGAYISGRNYDGNDTEIVIVKTHPANGFASTSIVPLKALGLDTCADMTLENKICLLTAPYAATDGVNEKGLSVSLMRLNAVCPQKDNDKTDIYPAAALRVLLDKADNVKNAVELLNTLNMHFEEGESWQFLISDKKGNSAVVSYEKGTPTVTEKQSSFHACSGAFLNDTGIGYKKTGSTHYEMGIKVLKNNMGEISVDQGIDLLDYISSKDGKDGLSTQWSVIFELKSASVQLCPHMEYSKVYTYETK